MKKSLPVFSLSNLLWNYAPLKINSKRKVFKLGQLIGDDE